ncbi:LysR family transcriptional regulator [Solemya pervernicosa gill symbiont]|uniref:LysR family transcriptional regulator n=2 Tax=Gammaproteobacteria incertae sedis TaxID=118884 RepID=A0A1T2LB71_9GAMM|nr:hydrogen peroxide-inducible genes activator [Candidatus Reidiella endopervernicosa]OOZ42353.1 LysR family transcriptional regulator [Solemya pervernicosa gill symbiont]QKQ25741.1 LysR family transcriptional regulator [Candidatus Reidiella endopervernicosa]
MNLPTVKQLRYFIALTEREHFGRAAESVFVSQSAFSVAIKDLETLLGVQLVDRTNKQVTITTIGREIAEKARHCVGEIELLVDLAQCDQAPLTGTLKLGVIPTIAPFLLPKILPALRQRYPELKLYLVEETTRRVYGRLMDGELDLILIALPFALRNVELHTLFQDPFLLAYRDGTRILDPDNYAVENLPDDSVLLLEDGHCLRDHALSACHLNNPNQISRFAASSLLTLVEMVEADMAITYLPEMAEGTPLLKNTAVKTVALKEKSYREIGLAWRRGSARGDEFKLLGELIKKYSGRA